MKLMRVGSVEVLCAEVVFNPMQLYINASEMDDASMPEAIHFLHTIRYVLTLVKPLNLRGFI